MTPARAVALVTLALVTAAAASQPGPVVISIVGTADLHGRFEGSGGNGGLALLGGYLANLRAARRADGGAVVLLDTGDTFQGGISSNLSEGAAVVDAYNALGYTALAVGNHDFEYGAVDTWDAPALPTPDLRGALKARAAQARFPFLAANLIDEATGRVVAWPNVRPTTIVDAAGVRVGIVGVMTLHALSMTLAANVHGLDVAPLAETIAREARALRASGAQLVIVASHAGGACTTFDDPSALGSCDPEGEMFEVARTLPPGLVDAIVGGHTHGAVAHEVHGIPIVQAHYWGQAFSRVDLTVDRGRGAVAVRRIFPPQFVCARQSQPGAECPPASAAAPPAAYEGRAVAPDAAITAAMAPALARVDAIRATPLGATLDAPMRRGPGDVESPLGNLFADALRAAVPGADVAISYSSGPGGLRSELAAGPVTRGALYDVFPFDNRVARLQTTGEGLRRLLEDRVRRSRWRGRSLGVSGVQVTVTCANGDLAVALARPSGTAIEGDTPLVVATTDFLTTWIGGGRAPDVGGRAQVLDLQLRDVVERWLRGAGPVPVDRFADPQQPRWVSRGVAGCLPTP